MWSVVVGIESEIEAVWSRYSLVGLRVCRQQEKKKDRQARASGREAEDMHANVVDRLNRARPQLSMDQDEIKNRVETHQRERRQSSGGQGKRKGRGREP
jgi:hypothetical protein